MKTTARLPRRKRRAKKADKITPAEVLAAIVACPRCSFFLSGYRLIHDDFDSAAQNNEQGWLELTWNQETRKLLHKSYGFTIDSETYHFEGICKECNRAFAYSASEEDAGKAAFLVEVVPGR